MFLNKNSKNTKKTSDDAEHQIEKAFEDWYPMDDEFNNPDMNKYETGPGHGLQGVPLTSKNQRKTQRSYLVLSNVPKLITKQTIEKLCLHYTSGVTGVSHSQELSYYFVNFSTEGDMITAYNKLINNEFGIKVRIGKPKEKDPIHLTNDTKINDTSLIGEQNHKNLLNLESRKHCISNKTPSRPKFEYNLNVTNQDYEDTSNLLQQNDPEKYYLVESDSHELERAGFFDIKIENSKYNYRTGRSFYVIPDETKKLIEKKCSESLVEYNEIEDSSEYNGIGISFSFGKCLECQRDCNLTCDCCSEYFCGLECQMKAWPMHHLACGQSKDFSYKNVERSLSPDESSDLESKESKLFEENFSNSSPKNNIEDYTSEDTLNTTSPESFCSVNSIKSSSSSLSSYDSARTLQYIKRNPENRFNNNIPCSGNVVTITTISEMNIVFIRSKSNEDNLEYFNTITTINAEAKNFNVLSVPPQRGQIVCAKFQGVFNRAMVLNIDNIDKIRIIYMDYGNVDEKQMHELYETPDHYAFMKRFIVPVILKDVPSCYFIDKVKEYMYPYLNDINMIIKYDESEDFIITKGVFQVNLYNERTNENFNEIIADLSNPVESLTVSKIYTIEYLEYNLLPAGDNIELVVMDNSLLKTGFISCTIKIYACEIDKFQKDIQRYGESLEPVNYAPRVRELCIAKYYGDDKWYRGLCLELAGDGYPSIIYIDYGNIAAVNVKDIRIYPSLFNFPVWTADCEIKDLPTHRDSKLVARLEELLPIGSTIRCDIFHENCVNKIDLPEIIKTLKEENF